MKIREIREHWIALNDLFGISLGRPIEDEDQYEAMLKLIGELMESHIDEVENGRLGDLVNVLADRVREYEERVHPWPHKAPAPVVLQELMDQHGLTQKDLPEIGAQPVVSAVLNGRRNLNLRQVKALAKRFHVPMEAFADPADKTDHHKDKDTLPA